MRDVWWWVTLAIAALLLGILIGYVLLNTLPRRI